MRRILCTILALSTLFGTAQAATYTVDSARSTAAFSGTHAGAPFKGTFKTWSADIAFDPAALATSHLNVTLQTASAATGNPLYDGTLPSTDWLDAAKHPSITFTGNTITARDAAKGLYTASGTLTLHGVSKPLSVAFTVTPPAADTPTTRVTSTFTLNRLDYAIGAKSDAKAEWVSRDVTLAFDVTARRH